MSIGQIAELTGLTKGFISQVERDKTSGSVASLMSICHALNIQISTLFEPPPVYLLRNEDRKRIRMTGEGVEDFLLSPSGGGRLQVIETIVEPGGRGAKRPYRLQSGGEFVLVLEGELRIEIESTSYDLSTGDALTFRAHDLHTWSNLSQENPARVLWVLTPDVQF